MINHKDKDLNMLDKKRIYLMDKIYAYFTEVREYKTNPTTTKKPLVKKFNDKLDEGLKIFK